MQIQWSHFLLRIFLCIPLLSACGGSEDNSPLHDSKPDIDETAARRDLHLLPRQDKNCSINSASSRLGDCVKIWVYQGEQPSQVQLDMRHFSGKGITSSLVKGVHVGATGERSSTPVSTILQYSEGTPIPICRENGGYNLDSIENSGLLLAYKTHETMRLNREIHASAHRQPLQIYLQPLLVKRSTNSFFADNAMHVGDRSELFFLPHSHLFLQRQGIRKIPYYHNWMAIGHEITHNLFHNLVLRGKKAHAYPMFVAALDEAIADLGGHLHGYQPHFSISRARDLLDSYAENPKKITQSTVRKLEAGILDVHEVGSFLAYGFYQMLRIGLGKYDARAQLQFLFLYLDQLRQAEWKETGSDFLSQSVELFGNLLAVEQGFLYESQCKIVRKVFPFFTIADNTFMSSWGCSL